MFLRARNLARLPLIVAAALASGLNENYGRELMELHTLSVNGGYSQRDVAEVAKVFTGWTLEQPAKGGGFHFAPRMHEPTDKIVLGHRIKENGEKEGMEVLRMLARSPKTAHLIALIESVNPHWLDLARDWYPRMKDSGARRDASTPQDDSLRESSRSVQRDKRREACKEVKQTTKQTGHPASPVPLSSRESRSERDGESRDGR